MSRPKKTRILIVTDSPVLPSGMAETTRLIFGALLRNYPSLYDVQQVGLFHYYAVTEVSWAVHPTETSNDGIVTKLAVDDLFGQKTFQKVINTFSPDIVFAFNDPQNVLHLCAPPSARKHKLILYLNFDGYHIPPVHGAQLSNADLIVTMSDFSLNVARSCLKELGDKELCYLYSPADMKRFSPASDDEKRTLRRDLLPRSIPEDFFILGWVGRNQWRKQVWVLYKVLH